MIPMATVLPSHDHQRASSAPLAGLGRWLAEMIHHAFGDPRQEARLQPPAVGVQAFSGWRNRRRGPFG